MTYKASVGRAVLHNNDVRFYWSAGAQGKTPGTQSTHCFIFHLNRIPSSLLSPIHPSLHRSSPPRLDLLAIYLTLPLFLPHRPISRRDPQPFKGQVIQGHRRVSPADWLTSARTSACSQSRGSASLSSLHPPLAARHVIVNGLKHRDGND